MNETELGAAAKAGPPSQGWREQHDQLHQLLALDHEPVGVRGVAAPPHPTGKVSAAPACTLWREGAGAPITADAARHSGCRVGSHVMGFPVNSVDQRELERIACTMVDVSYLDPDEVSLIPRLPEHAAWRYAALADMESAPDLVVLWLKPGQMMLINEALGGAHWKYPKGIRITGRPACAALACAYESGEPVMSFGCTGMRTFTGIPDHYLLFVVPGARVEALCSALAHTVSANRAMRMFYDEHKEKRDP
ncbi:MAG: DUF169 domain-containing protein [Acidiferrobacteraceae bacterium]